MNRFIDEHYQEALEKEEEVEKLHVKLNKVTSLILELMSCRSPSLVYAMFLKENLLNYQMTCVMQDRTPVLQEPLEFSQAFNNSHVAIKNFLCEIFLHNLAIPNDRV